METLLAHITPLKTLIYFGIGFVVWYIAFGLEMYLNGGSLGRGKWWVFKCFWEEMFWFLPGGLTKRADYIREMVRPREHVSSLLAGHTYEEIREKNLYERVAKEMLGNGYYFWGMNVLLSFFLWPLALFALFLIIALNGVVGFGSYLHSVATTTKGSRAGG